MGTTDGYMDNIHSLRDQYGADVVVLIAANYLGSCGRAATIDAISNEAFAVTRVDCAIGNYSFAHEIGHLAGARHDTDPNTSPYAYGHGFRYDPGYWRTVMAVYDSQVNRIPYWSNPNKTYGGVAMGTTSRKDNARVWGERAATVAAFRAAPQFSVGITGLWLFAPDDTGFWGASANNGMPPYSFSWYRSYSSSSGPWTTVGTGSSYSQTVSQQMWLKLTGSDSGSETDQDIMEINITNCSTPPCPKPKIATGANSPEKPQQFLLQQNYPNPFNPITQISYALPEAAQVTITVYNIMGQQVATLVNTSMSVGFHEVNFDAGSLSSGMYLARMEAISQSGEVFSKELKMQLVK